MPQKLEIPIGTIFNYWKTLELHKAGKVLCLCIGCNKSIQKCIVDKLRRGKQKSCGCMTIQMRKESFLEKYGVEHALQDPTIMEKAQNTNLKRWGFENAFQNSDLQEKQHQTNLERYGAKNPQQNKDVRTKTSKTNIERYGGIAPATAKEVRAKMQQTMIERYNVPFCSQVALIMQKKKVTSLEKYGVEFAGTDPAARTRARNTMKERYGVEHALQNKNFALKAVKSSRNTYIRFHWKTKEELVCTASYETKVVDYLNKNYINFTWQSRTFKLSTGKTYRPDLYLTDTDVWIEIKGYFREASKKKWDEFHTKIQTNSELWDKEKLILMGIL